MLNNVNYIFLVVKICHNLIILKIDKFKVQNKIFFKNFLSSYK